MIHFEIFNTIPQLLPRTWVFFFLHGKVYVLFRKMVFCLNTSSMSSVKGDTDCFGRWCEPLIFNTRADFEAWELEPG